jgi:hypothetical protein
MFRLVTFQKVRKEVEFSSNWSIVQNSVCADPTTSEIYARKYISTKSIAALGAS